MADEQNSNPLAAIPVLRALKYNTFLGLYLPALLTTLGVVLYLRLGWMVGHTGVYGSVLIISVASGIALITGISIAATATNMNVGAGGPYYMISRSFGIEAGASIGLPLYFAATCGAAFYALGFAEAVGFYFPELPHKLMALLALGVMAFLSWSSTASALKAQLFIFIAITLSMISIFCGRPPNEGWEQLETVADTLPFWSVFAVFFPAVTGFIAGVSMSGDLKDPARSLPLGTIGAVLTAFILYLSLALFAAKFIPLEILRTDPHALLKMAVIPAIAILGLFGASLSSVLGSLLAAPRIMQTMARDHILPSALGRGEGPSHEPRTATLLTFLLAMLAVLTADFNMIAAILTMFFLTAFGMLNLSAGLESFIGNPSWRPSFRSPWWVSILGALACLLAMLMIHSGATIIAVICILIVYLGMKKRGLSARWSDIRGALLTLGARTCVYSIASTSKDARSWRPNVLVLSGSPHERWHLITLADAITHGKGFMTVATVLPKGKINEDRLDQMQNTIKEYLNRQRIPALVKVTVADSVMNGAKSLIRYYGLGPLIPNTILMGVTAEDKSLRMQVELLFLCVNLKRNLILVREGEHPLEHMPFEENLKIHVWMGKTKNNNALILALGTLLQTSPEWGHGHLELWQQVLSIEEKETTTLYLENFSNTARLDAKVNVVKVEEETDLFDSTRKYSLRSNLLITSLRKPDPGESIESYLEYYQLLLKRLHDLPAVALVLAGEEIDFSKILE
jgi:solute carrier family 12 (sodium/potassium/chloride transporter), member 2